MDATRPSLPAQAQQPALKPLGRKTFKQAAVASMFKAAKPSLVVSRPAQNPTATEVPGLGPRGEGTMAQGSDSLTEFTADMQHEKLAGTRDVLSHAEVESGCVRENSGSAAHDQSPVTHLGEQHNDLAHSAEAHHRANQGCSEAGLLHASVGQLHGNDAASGGHDALHSVDLAEQKQILHDVWLERNALSARVSAKRPITGSKADSKRAKLTSGNSRQTQIFGMLRKPP